MLPVLRGFREDQVTPQPIQAHDAVSNHYKAFTLPDEGENSFGQTGELGGKRIIALVVRRSDNWLEIVLSTGAKHTMPAEVIPSPNNFRQLSQQWKHQFIPHLFPPKINFPAAHLQFIFQVDASSLYLQFLKGLQKASFKQNVQY